MVNFKVKFTVFNHVKIAGLSLKYVPTLQSIKLDQMTASIRHNFAQIFG